MRRIKKNSGMYQYLESKGLLDKGPEALASGKAEYRKEYLRNHKKTYRTRVSEHSISCKPTEERMLTVAAKEHGMKVAEYVRMAAIAYTQKKYLVPRVEAVHQMLQTLIFTRTQIERIGQEKRNFLLRSKNDRIEELLESLNRDMRSAFYQPPDIEQEIRKALNNNPGFSDVLKKIMAECDCQIIGTKE